MKCPHCGSRQIRRNGHRRSKQNYRCKDCDRQFVEFYSPRGYSEDARQICLRMHQLGIGFREIERLTGVSHNTLIQWVKQTEDFSGEAEADKYSIDSDFPLSFSDRNQTLRNIKSKQNFISV